MRGSDRVRQGMTGYRHMRFRAVTETIHECTTDPTIRLEAVKGAKRWYGDRCTRVYPHKYWRVLTRHGDLWVTHNHESPPYEARPDAILAARKLWRPSFLWALLPERALAQPMLRDALDCASPSDFGIFLDWLEEEGLLSPPHDRGWFLAQARREGIFSLPRGRKKRHHQEEEEPIPYHPSEETDAIIADALFHQRIARWRATGV